MEDMEIDADYDLDTLLELREQEHQDASDRYAEALQQHERLQRQLEESRAEHRRMVEDRRRQCRRFHDEVAAGPESMARIQEFDRYLVGLQDREKKAEAKIEKLCEQCQKAEARRERAKEAMVEAVRKLEAVKKHYEQWSKKRQMESKRRRADAMDEVAARVWRDNKG